jgi:hypothetical protein
MTRIVHLLCCLIVVLTGCGSRTLYGITLSETARLPDDRVQVSGRVSISFLGTRSDDVVTEVCVNAVWSETAQSTTDGGSDGGLTDDGGVRDGGSTGPGRGPFTPVDVNEPVGPVVATATACPLGPGSTFSLTSSAPIPTGRRIVLGITPFESEASRQRTRDDGSTPPVQMTGLRIVSP